MNMLKKKLLRKVPNPNKEPKQGKMFRLFDFQTYDHKNEKENEEEKKKTKDKKEKEIPHFRIQMFGINEQGETCALFVENMNPFFYVQVGDHWGMRELKEFERDIRKKLSFVSKSLLELKLVDSKKLYEFTAGTQFRFIQLIFKNQQAFQKARGLWYDSGTDDETGEYSRKYKPYRFDNIELMLYESKIPPLLRYFHIQNISPSGWVMVYDHLAEKPLEYTTTCHYEYICQICHIVPLPQKEDLVPYRICSFDIEANSSHGDFPVPVKNYKRLATQLVDSFLYRIQTGDMTFDNKNKCTLFLKKTILSAFLIGASVQNIDQVYLKEPMSKEAIQSLVTIFLNEPLQNLQKKAKEEGKKILKITSLFEKIAEDAKSLLQKEDIEEEGEVNEGELGTGVNEITYYRPTTKKIEVKHTAVEVLFDNELSRESKIRVLNETMTTNFPPLKGDEITFIGTTFIKNGEIEPYKNHCLVVGSCDPVHGTIIQSVETERECLIRWAELIQDENPDIIIGYNIFGFDYEFMFQRSKELKCVDEFTTLSRVLSEKGYKKNYQGEKSLEQTKNRLASGDYDLRYPLIAGRLQIDLLFYFRRDYNLSSYKLDDVAGSFIRDDIKGIEFLENEKGESVTYLYSKNLVGLHVDDFIHLEISSFTTDYYQKGKKFRVLDIHRDVEIETNRSTVSKGKYNVIVISGHYLDLDVSKNVKWGMAKDDVSPQDIFRLSKESAKSRAIVAKYCIQDCNLVHHLMRKIDVLTGYVEMARICNVPISFLVFRGQGIKLTSYVAKVCREKQTLMPDLEHNQNADGYEGAIVLPPKCAMYGENPVACVDYSSLYPSIAKGWNLSPNSKVWTKLYDLEGKLIKINDRTIVNNEKELLEKAHLYDDLPEYHYINVEFDHFETVQMYTANGKLGRKEKVKCGKKVCRWAQFPDGQEGIIPCIIGDLLKARKDTRTAAENEKDPFISNILDKRQLGYKVTANSLYGQMGSSVSTFFEKDVAASITSIGRQMITYAKKMVEEIYGDSLYTTKKGEVVRTRSAYVYGDTDSVFFTFHLEEPENGKPIRGKRALEITIELAEETAQLCSLYLPAPMKLAYEKTLMSFILLSKKRYVGMLYETDPNKGKLKFMGLPLKRRDSCDYLKDVYGGILTILMKEPENIQKAIDFLTNALQDLIQGKVSMEKLAITKALRSDYKNPDQIAHKVLSERIGERDPGNKPKAGDRIKFVFIYKGDKNALLGERIETPEFITQNKLPIDYTYYITNQLMNPLQQMLGLTLENIYSYKKTKQSEIIEYRKTIETLFKESNQDLEIFSKKREKYCSAQVKRLIFDPFLQELYNKQNKIQTMHHFYRRK